MDLDAVADELYDTAPEDFVALRTARAAEAKAVGDRELAQQLTALRKPTRSAWIANLVAHHAAEDLTGLLDLGTAIAEAQQRLSGDDLRRLSGQRHAAIAALVQRGVQLAAVRGHTATEATRREVSETLQAALSDPEIATEVRAGRLTQPRSYGGFGPGFAAPAPAAAPAQTPPEPEEQATAARDEERVAELNRTQQQYDRVSSRLEHTETLLARAAESAELKTARVSDLRDQLARAEQESERADADLARLSTDRDELRAEQQRAEEAVTAALSGWESGADG